MPLQKSILKVIAYFDLFHYPVTPEEILVFLDQPAKSQDVAQQLDQMKRNRMIFRHNEFYSLHDEPALSVKRIEGNLRAAALLPEAKRISNFLYHFPFVRAVAISGSLSKNYASPDADIDYFIITAPNRLWLARTLMHLYKKFSFLVGRQHYYCMNYFLDEAALEIKEKNLFTAIELITLMPVCGNGTVDHFFSRNQWAAAYYPNYAGNRKRPNTRRADGWFKKRFEKLFDNRFGERLDNYFLRLTTKRWREKEQLGRRNIKGGRMGLDTGKHFSKPNPVFFQQKILHEFSEKLNTQPLFAQELI